FDFPGGAVAVRSLVGERFKPRLAAYPGPTLILNGEYVLFFRPSERSFAAAAVHPKRVLIRGATHHANLDRPEAFTAAIRRFAESIPRRDNDPSSEGKGPHDGPIRPRWYPRPTDPDRPNRGFMRVRKAVFPAAGWGTRFLPATKAQPKEMLPLVDKPII